MHLSLYHGLFSPYELPRLISVYGKECMVHNSHNHPAFQAGITRLAYLPVGSVGSAHMPVHWSNPPRSEAEVPYASFVTHQVITGFMPA